MAEKVTTLEDKIRTKARVKYYQQVDQAWVAFQAATRVQSGSYSRAIHELGKGMIEALKIERKPEVEQMAVDDFLKRFEEFGEQLESLHHGN